MTTSPSKGQCLCGSVRFEAEIANSQIHACHCRQCQRWTGGSPLTVLRVKDVMVEGEEVIQAYHASEWGERAFCGKCGTALYWKMQGKPINFLPVGLFDDLTGLSISEEIFADQRPDWQTPVDGATQSTAAEMHAQLQAYLDKNG